MNLRALVALLVVVVSASCSKNEPTPPSTPPASTTPPPTAPVDLKAGVQNPVDAGKQVDAGKPAKPFPGRRFLLVEGGATYNGKAAKTGDALGDKGTIVVSRKGRVVLALAPGSFAVLRPGTRADLGRSERKTSSLTVTVGAIWSFIARGSSYEVVTGNAVAGVRGTAFYTEAKKNESYVCDCDGTIELRAGGPKALPRNIDSDRAHIGTYVKGRGKGMKAGAAARTGHTDEEREQLMKLFDQAGGYQR
jgi:hypothetical protein